MISKFVHPFILICLLLVLSSCSNNTVVNESKSIQNPWKSIDPISFQFDISDTIGPYQFAINVRNNTDYDYSNIYFFITTTFPDGHLSRDTVECILADVRGKWLGSGMGSIKESSHIIRNNLLFPQSGTYVMQIEQAMREQKLEGIEDIGIKIEKKID